MHAGQAPAPPPAPRPPPRPHSLACLLACLRLLACIAPRPLQSPRHRPRAGLQPGSDSGSDDGGYAGGEDGGRASGWRPSVRQLLQDAQRDWGQHVLLQQVAHTPTFGGGCVSSLGVCGGGSGGGGGATAMVVASDFMGSLTLLQAVATPKGASLLPTSADRHPIFAQVGVPVCVPVFVCVCGGGHVPWLGGLAAQCPAMCCQWTATARPSQAAVPIRWLWTGAKPFRCSCKRCAGL